MPLGFVASDAMVLAVQAGIVAAPKVAPEPLQRVADRMRGPAWALIPVGSIIGVIFAIRYASGTANWLTWLALIAVPLLAIAALGWLMKGARWWLMPLGLLMFVAAWRTPESLLGQGCATLLSALSCVTLGVLLGSVTPPLWLKLGVIAMAGADVWLTATDLLETPNYVLVAAAPGHGLPQLQSESFGSINMGYGDFFVAGLLGALWSQRPRVQSSAALLTLALAGVFDLLFFAFSELPATVPVALALVVVEIWSRRQGRVELSEKSGPWKRAAGIPRPSS